MKDWIILVKGLNWQNLSSEIIEALVWFIVLLGVAWGIVVVWFVI